MRHHHFQSIQGSLLVLWAVISSSQQQWPTKMADEVRCPTFFDTPDCSCAASPDGLDFDCNSATVGDIQSIISAARFVIKTLSVAKFDQNATCLCEKIFTNGSVTTLSFANSRLTSIGENVFDAPAVRLHTLNLHNAELTTLPRAVGKVSSLRHLDLEANKIREIFAYTFFGPSKLSYINLKGNQLDSLAENAFLGLENNLRELNLMDNQFQSFPLSAVKILKKLQSLNMAGNLLENVTFESFSRLDSLKHLDLSKNQFSFLAKDTFESLPNLQRVSLSGNRIKVIEAGVFDGLHDLETLDLSQNSLSELPRDIFLRTSRLLRVDLSHNRLRGIKHVFVDLYALEEVFLNDNLLLSLTNTWFSNTPNLKVIHLEGNVISEISDNALHTLKRLTQLYLSHNFLSEITASHFRYNVALTSLSLDNNHIETVDTQAFHGVPKLKQLKLQNNIIRLIPRDVFSSLISLNELHLEDNKIVEIEPQAFAGLANLQHLDLTGNWLPKLEDIMMRYPSALRTAYLDSNYLESFHKETFSGQTTAEILSLSNNKLERIPANAFVELINLFRLNLAHNRLLEIEDNAFIGLHQLRYLDLSHNRLAHLSALTLRGLQQADTVDLSHNRISTVESEAFTGFHHLKHLDLSHNRLRVLKNGAFRGCLTLKTLLLNNAGVKTIQANALADFKVLDVLNLQGNELAIPDSISRLRTLVSVRTLVLSGNDLSNMSYVANKGDLNLDPMEHLERLELEGCNLSNFSSRFFRKNDKLKVIKLGENKLAALEAGMFKKQVFLQELSLDRNQFKMVPGPALKYLLHLATFNFSGNQVRSLGESSFDNVGGLKVLDFSHNGLQSVAERAFHNITNLQHLILSHNQLRVFETSTFVPLAALHSFNAKHNQLEFIPVAVQGLRKVQILEFSGNPMERLKEIPESRAVMLTMESLILTGTNLTTISPTDFDLFPSLVTLDLSGNKLSRVAPYAFRSLAKVQSLDLSRNDIIHLSRERLFGLFQLKTLNLSRNHLGSLDAFPTDLATLAILDVSFNRLRNVARDSLKHLTGLIQLDLRGNLLTALFPEVFHSLRSIKAIDLRWNQLRVLPLEELVSAEDSLESINFEGNPLVCSCQSYSQKAWLRQHRKWLNMDVKSAKVGPQCHEPGSVADRFLLTVKDSDLCPLPSVSSLTFNNIDPNNFLITWESPDTNMTGLKGFIVAYHRLDQNDQVKKYRVGPTIRGFRINMVNQNSRYLVCVITRGSSYKDGEADYDYMDDYGSEDLPDEEDSNQFYVMPLELTEEGQTFSELEQPKEGGQTAQSASNPLFEHFLLFGFGSSDDKTDLNTSSNDTFFDLLSYPSSNDTELFVTRPTVVNLGSQSSKCIQIRTPLDPAKLSLIDNKRVSVVIGVSMGLIVFVLIIISIVTAKPKHKDEDEEDVPITDSANNSQKSPKNSNSFLLKQTSMERNGPTSSNLPPRLSRSESQNSSLLSRPHPQHQHLTDETPIQPDRRRNKTKDRTRSNPTESGTLLRRGHMSRQVSEEATKAMTLVAPPTEASVSKSNRTQRTLAKQSSTDSGDLSRQSSSDSNPRHSRRNSDGYDGYNHNQEAMRTGTGPGGQTSWHGTPRVGLRHRNTMFDMRAEAYSTTFPRRNAESGLGRVAGFASGSGMSLDSSSNPNLLKRRSDPSHLEGSNTSIPLIEYHVAETNHRGNLVPSFPPGPPMYRPPPPPPGMAHGSMVHNPHVHRFPGVPPGYPPMRWNRPGPPNLGPSKAPMHQRGPVLNSMSPRTNRGDNHPLPPPPPAAANQVPLHPSHLSTNHSGPSPGLPLGAHTRIGNHVGGGVNGGENGSLAPSNGVTAEDLESIDYYPDAPTTPRSTLSRMASTNSLGRPPPPSPNPSNVGAMGGPRPFLKYNSFANY